MTKFRWVSGPIHKNTLLLSIFNYLVHAALPYNKSLRCHRLFEHQTLLRSVLRRWYFQQQAMDLHDFYRLELPFDCETFSALAPMHSAARPAPSGSEPVMFQNNTNNIEHRAITTLIKNGQWLNSRNENKFCLTEAFFLKQK